MNLLLQSFVTIYYWLNEAKGLLGATPML